MKKNVLILMSTYNGEKYLKEQIDSILKQIDVNVSILVRDDGSKDNTQKILNEYQEKGQLNWYAGKNIGPAQSFFDLIENAPFCEYYALCDQDDVWLEDKMKIALDKLEKCNNEIPSLYYGRPRLVDQDLNIIDNPNSSKDKMLTYGSSIINSNAVGCTMVFNRCLVEKVIKGKRPNYVQMHDTWIHKVCLIYSGNVLIDDDVHILYRQHKNNTIGISNSKIKRIKEHLKSFSSKECSRSKTIKELYNHYYNDMNENDRKLSELVINYQKKFKYKLKLCFNKQIKTTSMRRNILFKFAVLFNIF